MIICAPCHFLPSLESFDGVFLETIRADTVDVPLLQRKLSGPKIHQFLHEYQAAWSCLSHSTTMNLAVFVLLHLGDAVHLLAVALVDDDEAVAAPEEDVAAPEDGESKVPIEPLEPDRRSKATVLRQIAWGRKMIAFAQLWTL